MATRFPYQPIDPFGTNPQSAEETPAWALLQSQRPRRVMMRPSLLRSMGYAVEGIRFAFRTERNFRIHCAVSVLAGIAAWALHLPVHQVVLVIAVSLLVLCAELMNTAIESTLDMHVGDVFDPTVKAIKDIAAASVLVVSLGAGLLGASIFLPVLFRGIAR